MNISKKEYAQLADRYSVPSKLYITLPKAFVIGGLICCIGQFFNDLYIMIGNDADTASAYTSITLVLISALLTGFGQYERIAKHAGAGTLVPITGFANGVCSSACESPALEFKTEGLILGTGAKMFIIAGPVIVYGITAAFVYGIILFVISLFGG